MISRNYKIKWWRTDGGSYIDSYTTDELYEHAINRISETETKAGQLFLILYDVAYQGSYESETVIVEKKTTEKPPYDITKHKHKPLPDCIELGEGVDGLGLIATEKLRIDKFIGISHVETNIPKFKDSMIRTAIGSYVNHSDIPNCLLVKTDELVWELQTSKVIKQGEELLIDYSLYPCGKTTCK